MNSSEIRSRVSANNTAIQSFLEKGIFILNADITKLLAENSMLQSECLHSFVNGVCEYCDYEEQE